MNPSVAISTYLLPQQNSLSRCEAESKRYPTILSRGPESWTGDLLVEYVWL